MNWFKRLRRYIIIKTAESYYNRMTLQCVELHKKTRHHHYIIIDPWQGKKVIITNRDNFRATKRVINDSGIRLSVRTGELTLTDVTMPDVHSGCFYSSLLQTQLEKLQQKPEENARAIRKMENDIEARRRAYIQWTLDNAKIRHRKTRQQRREERIIRKELRAYHRKRKN
jgi:hypothetical protein